MGNTSFSLISVYPALPSLNRVSLAYVLSSKSMSFGRNNSMSAVKSPAIFKRLCAEDCNSSALSSVGEQTSSSSGDKTTEACYCFLSFFFFLLISLNKPTFTHYLYNKFNMFEGSESFLVHLEVY